MNLLEERFDLIQIQRKCIFDILGKIAGLKSLILEP